MLFQRRPSNMSKGRFQMGFKQPGDGSQDGETSAGAVAGNQPKSLREHPANSVHDYSQPLWTDPVQGTAPNAPTFLMRGVGSGLQAGPWKVSRRQNLLKAIAARLGLRGSIWRGSLVRDAPKATAPRRTAGMGGATFAFLAFLVITICAGAVVALTHINALKTEIASLQRELLPLRERLARFDQAEKVREAETKATAKTSKAWAQDLSPPAPLTFSREEVQLIREYIKPAPFGGPAAPAVNVGDPFTGGTIPFPSPLTDKVPKLLGARFAIRNGAIVIVRKDSRRADAVLGPN
jgi:hypothetical protein